MIEKARKYLHVYIFRFYVAYVKNGKFHYEVFERSSWTGRFVLIATFHAMMYGFYRLGQKYPTLVVNRQKSKTN